MGVVWGGMGGGGISGGPKEGVEKGQNKQPELTPITWNPGEGIDVMHGNDMKCFGDIWEWINVLGMGEMWWRKIEGPITLLPLFYHRGIMFNMRSFRFQCRYMQCIRYGTLNVCKR